MENIPVGFDRLQEILWDFAGHRVITVAGRTGVLRVLAEHDATPAELAAELELEPFATAKVVRALHAIGLAESEGQRYRLAPTLAPFFRPGPDDMTPFLEHSHDLYDRWGENLERWLRGEEWRTQRRGPEGQQRFGAAMRAMGSHLASQAAGVIDLSGVDRLLDVGGGFGHYAAAMCRVRPTLRATVLDTPDVARLARDMLAGSELDGRIDFVGGDYLEDSYGEGFDLVLLANVLHQETPERAAEMVHHSAAALAPGGRVAVIDFAIDDEQRENVLGTLFAINMRSFGDTHPERVIRGWMEGAGLGDLERIDLGRHRWIIVGRKPG